MVFFYIYNEISWTISSLANRCTKNRKGGSSMPKDNITVLTLRLQHLENSLGISFEVQQSEYLLLKYTDDNRGVQSDDLTKTTDSEKTLSACSRLITSLNLL